MAFPLGQSAITLAAWQLGFIAVAGLLFGSFLNVCIVRLPRRQSIVWPGSRCPHCLTPIRPLDNIPVLSWLLLGRRCRACRGLIHWRYPVIESALAALWLLCVLRFGLTVDGLSAAALCFLLLGLLAMDAETMLLPDTFTLPGLGLGLVHAALAAGPPLLHRVADAGGAMLAALAGAALMLMIRWGYWLLRRRHGLGLGDVKLVAMIAAWLGMLPTMLTFVLATLAASLAGLAALGLRGRRGSREEDWQTLRLPLGAFLSGAALLVLFLGKPLLDWYLGLFR